MRTGVPRRTTSRAGKTLKTVHIDQAGPYEASMGGFVNLIMFVDSAWRWMEPYRVKTKSESVTYVWKFVTDITNMGRPHCFHTDIVGGFIDRGYAEICDSAGVRREYTTPTPGKSYQEAVVESGMWRAMKDGRPVVRFDTFSRHRSGTNPQPRHQRYSL